MSHNKQQAETIEGWDDLYLSYEQGKPVGIEYPTEALVRFIANQRKDRSVKEYFDDKGREYSLKRNFSGNALEIGFGSIANLKMVAEKGYNCFGLEVSQEAVKRGNQIINEEHLQNIQLQLWKPYRLPFQDDYFALVYGLQCIYYNLELESVIEDIFRVLAPGGNFLFSFFSTSHTYMNFLRNVTGKICKWSDDHPNRRLRGIYLRQPKSEQELMELFSDFDNVRVFKTETDQTPLFESWWYASGSKPE